MKTGISPLYTRIAARYNQPGSVGNFHWLRSVLTNGHNMWSSDSEYAKPFGKHDHHQLITKFKLMLQAIGEEAAAQFTFVIKNRTGDEDDLEPVPKETEEPLDTSKSYTEALEIEPTNVKIQFNEKYLMPYKLNLTAEEEDKADVEVSEL